MDTLTKTVFAVWAKTVFAVWAGVVIANLAFWGTVIYIAYHFIAKAW